MKNKERVVVEKKPRPENMKAMFSGHEGAHVDYANLVEPVMTTDGDVLLRFYHQRPQPKGQAHFSKDGFSMVMGDYDTMEFAHQRSIVVTKDAVINLNIILSQMIKNDEAGDGNE